MFRCPLFPIFFSCIQVLPSCFTIFETVYMFRRPLFSIFFPIYRFCHPVLPSFKQCTCSAAHFFQYFFLYTGSAILFYHLLNSILSYIQVLPSCLPSFKQYTCSAAPFFQYFFLYTGSAILFNHLLNSIHVPPPPFSIFFSYIQVLPSCLPSFKQYTCSAAPFFQYFFPVYRFCHPVLPSLKQYTCSAAPFFQYFFLYTGSAILFYHLLNSVHVPPPTFFNIFSYIQVLPSCFTIF